MKGLKFEDSKGRVVKVENVESNIATLNNGERVAVERLSDSSFYKQISEANNNQSINESQSVVERHNPDPNPPKNRYEQMLEGINNGVNNNANPNPSTNDRSISIGDDGDVNLSPVNLGLHGQQSHIKMSGNVVEKRQPNVGNTSVVEQHQPRQLTPDEQEQELLNKYGKQTPNPSKGKEKLSADATLEDLAYDKKEKPKAVDVNARIEQQRLDREQQRLDREQQEVQKGNKVYDNAKKTHSLKVDLKIDEKIPDKTVFKFLEDNFDFDESPVEYYSRYIFNKLMEDPKILEDQIKQSIEKYVKSRKSNSKS